MIIQIALLCIGLNIVSQLSLIKKDHEKVLSTDYINWAVESIIIASCVGMSYTIIEFLIDAAQK